MCLSLEVGVDLSFFTLVYIHQLCCKFMAINKVSMQLQSVYNYLSSLKCPLSVVPQRGTNNVSYIFSNIRSDPVVEIVNTTRVELWHHYWCWSLFRWLVGCIPQKLKFLLLTVSMFFCRILLQELLQRIGSVDWI